MTRSQPIPPESEMTRDDALTAFVTAVNLAQPEHTYLDRRLKNISKLNVDFGVTRRYYARCGPRDGNPICNDILITYQTRLTYINTISRETHLALLAHEMSHLNYYSGDIQDPGHPARFWDEYAFNASELRDAVSTGETAFGEVDDKQLCEAIISDPNSNTVDRRSHSVTEVRQRVATLIGEPELGPDN